MLGLSGRALTLGTKPPVTDAEALTADSILEGIHYFRVHDHVRLKDLLFFLSCLLCAQIQLLAVAELLPSFVREHPRVRLCFPHA